MGLEQKDEKLYFVICDVHKIAMYDKIWGIWVVSKNNRVTKSYQELPRVNKSYCINKVKEPL